MLQQAISKLIHRCRENCVIRASTRATKAPIPTPEGQPLHSIHIALHAHPDEDKPIMIFTRSQLPGAAFSDSITDAIDVIFGNPDVQRAASQARMKLMRLVDFTSLRSEIAASINVAVGPETNVANLSPEAVIAVLARRADELDEAYDAAREDRAAHDRAHAARLERLRPLCAAVSALATRAGAEHDSLMMHLDSLGRTVGGPGDAAKTEDPVKKAGELRARIEVVNGISAQCSAFHSDPYKSVKHLDGLGLGAAIATHTASKGAVA